MVLVQTTCATVKIQEHILLMCRNPAEYPPRWNLQPIWNATAINVNTTAINMDFPAELPAEEILLTWIQY